MVLPHLPPAPAPALAPAPESSWAGGAGRGRVEWRLSSTAAGSTRPRSDTHQGLLCLNVTSITAHLTRPSPTGTTFSSIFERTNGWRRQVGCSEMEPGSPHRECVVTQTQCKTLTGVTQLGFLSSLLFSSEKATASIELCVAMRHHFCDTVMGMSCRLHHCQ